jgi:hypothetical protein
MPRKPRSTPTSTPTRPALAGPLTLSPEAQALHDRIASEWELSPAVAALLRLTAEALTKASECEAITAVEGMTVRDAKGSSKAHPAATLARDYRSAAGTQLTRLLAHLEGR